MLIAIAFHKFPCGAVKYVKMFCLKPLKINLNTVSETIVIGICSCILIQLVYDIFVKDAMVSCLNIYAIVKKDF